MRRTSAIPDGAVRGDQASDLQLLVDSAPSLIHTSRPDGYLDFFNQKWLTYVGRPLEDLQGWKWTAFIHPEDVEGIVETWRASLASGEPFLHEARVLRADGEYRWMLHHKVAVRDGSGQIVKWYGSSIDIEDRKRAEEQLRRSTQELQKSEFYLAEGQRLAHMGSWAFDLPDSTTGLLNYFGCTASTRPANRLPFRNIWIVSTHRIASPWRTSSRDSRRKLRPSMPPSELCDPMVRSGTFAVSGLPVVENQSLKKYVGSAIDVTEHELVTQELRRREAYLAEAQRLSHTGSFGWKPDSGRDCLVR